MSKLNGSKIKKKDAKKDIRNIEATMEKVDKQKRKYFFMVCILLAELVILNDSINLWYRAGLQLGVVILIIVEFVKAKRR